MNNCHQNHQHHHKKDQNGSRPHPLAGFFACLLGDEPAPISAKIQDLRQKLPDSQSIEENINEKLIISSDMVVLDLIVNFPKIKNYLEEIHPLGLLSPNLDKISLELFLSEFNLDLDKICHELTQLTHHEK
jgi:hypothetical protein